MRARTSAAPRNVTAYVNAKYFLKLESGIVCEAEALVSRTRYRTAGMPRSWNELQLFKQQQILSLEKEDKIWASMSNSFNSDDIDFTEFSLSSQHLDSHVVEGAVVKKRKRSVDATCEAMQQNKTSLSHYDILKSSKTYLSKSDFPEGTVFVKSEADIDYS